MNIQDNPAVLCAKRQSTRRRELLCIFGRGVKRKCFSGGPRQGGVDGSELTFKDASIATSRSGLPSSQRVFGSPPARRTAMSWSVTSTVVLSRRNHGKLSPEPTHPATSHPRPQPRIPTTSGPPITATAFSRSF